jgi:hypothetical protein
MAFFKSHMQRAVAYAAQKYLQKLLDDPNEPNLPHGVTYDVSKNSITITLPNNMSVGRDAGLNGDGIIQKKATQNLYGYAVWAFFLMRLKSFNQARVVRQMLSDAMHDAAKQTGKNNVEKELSKLDPELDEMIADLKKAKAPMRDEPTPRMVSFPTGNPVIQFNEKKAA